MLANVNEFTGSSLKCAIQWNRTCLYFLPTTSGKFDHLIQYILDSNVLWSKSFSFSMYSKPIS